MQHTKIKNECDDLDWTGTNGKIKRSLEVSWCAECRYLSIEDAHVERHAVDYGSNKRLVGCGHRQWFYKADNFILDNLNGITLESGASETIDKEQIQIGKASGVGDAEGPMEAYHKMDDSALQN